MKIKFLFPNKFRVLGWILAIPSFILMVFNLNYDFMFHFLDYQKKGTHKIFVDNSFLFNLDVNNFTDELGGILLITGLLLVAFSKEKIEDERTIKIRLESLLWAVYINSAFLILSIIFFYGELFLKIMAYNICTPLILFILKYRVAMYLDGKGLKNENL